MNVFDAYYDPAVAKDFVGCAAVVDGAGRVRLGVPFCAFFIEFENGVDWHPGTSWALTMVQKWDGLWYPTDIRPVTIIRP